MTRPYRVLLNLARNGANKIVYLFICGSRTRSVRGKSVTTGRHASHVGKPSLDSARLKPRNAWMTIPSGIPSLLGNINHPNDFGHWIYAQLLSALGL